MCENSPVLLASNARAGHLKEAVGTVEASNLARNAVIAANGVALFTEEQAREVVVLVGRQRRLRGRWARDGEGVQARAVDEDLRGRGGGAGHA